MAGGEFCQAGKDLGWLIKRATSFIDMAAFRHF